MFYERKQEIWDSAKEFGQGVCQQRVRNKTKERAGTLPLALSRIQWIVSPRTHNLADMIEVLQALDKSQLEAPPVEVHPVLFSKRDVFALKHNWKQYLEPFFLAILHEDLHRSNDGILEHTMYLHWLEPSEEDLLVYIVSNEDDNNPPMYSRY